MRFFALGDKSLWLDEACSSYLAPPVKETGALIKARFRPGERFVWRGYLGDIVVTKFY